MITMTSILYSIKRMKIQENEISNPLGNVKKGRLLVIRETTTLHLMMREKKFLQRRIWGLTITVKKI